MTEIPSGWALRGASIRERILVSIVIDENGCWLWQKYCRPTGYGEVGVPGDRARLAYRVAYEEWNGPVPDGLHLDHLCRVTRCVNPDHLEPVTPKENCLRGESPMAKNARRTHCPKGHPLSGENLFVERKLRRRRCRTCMQAHSRAQNEKLKKERARGL